MIAQKVVQRAIDDETDERKAYFKGIQAAVQNGVARAFGAK